MELQELEARQAENVRPVVAASLTVFSAFQDRALSQAEWLSVLEALYEVVRPAAIQSAELGRLFHDKERARVGLAPLDVRLRVPSFERFVREMEPVRRVMMSEGTPDSGVHSAALRVARTVENAGRRTVMQAQEIPESSGSAPLVKGWARMATGRETCAWCWAMVSRGPVYSSARAAGANVDDRDAVQLVGAGLFDQSEHMNQWHTGCDCKVVPVFKRGEYPGIERAIAAEQLWLNVTRGFTGHEKMKAFRRAVEGGQLHKILAAA